MHCKHSINTSNKNSYTTRNINSGRAIRDVPLQLNINVPGNFDNLNVSTIQTPRNPNQQENIESPPTIFDSINDNQPDNSCIIIVHSLDTSYTPSNTLILLNEPILDNENHRTIETDGEHLLHKLGLGHKVKMI